MDDPSNPSDSYDSCGQYYYNLGLTASGWDASAQGTQSCALNGEVWTAIIRRYYFDNSTQPGHVMLLDDSPALTEYYYSGNVWGGHLFAVNGAGVVKYRTYTRITDSWAGWFSLPTPQGECSSAPSAMSQGASQLWIMCRNTNGGISARRWDGTSWGSWLDFGGVSISAPATAEFGTSLEVYLVGTGGDIQKRTCSIAQSSCSSVGNWTAWQPLVQPGAGPPGGCTSSPAADLRVSELYVFCRGAVASANPKAPAYYNRYTSSTGWSGWTTVPGGDIVSGPAASNFYDGSFKLHLHGNTEPGHVWANQRSSTSWGGWYQPWPGAPGDCTSTSGTTNVPPSYDYFLLACRGSAGSFHSRRWDTATWSGWVELGSPP